MFAWLRRPSKRPRWRLLAAAGLLLAGVSVGGAVAWNSYWKELFIPKRLAEVDAVLGMEEGDVRSRGFRHTYCSARLQTVQRILKPGRESTDEDAWDFVEVSRFQVQKEMGHGGAQLVDRIYGHAQRLPYRSEVVEYRLEQHRDAVKEGIEQLENAAG